MDAVVTTPLPLRQVFNFRDLGGLPTGDGRRVRPGAVFRADGLHRLLPEDREVLTPVGLRTVIDLRTDPEVTERGVAPADVVGAAEVHHLPLIKEIWPVDDLAHSTPADAYLAGKYLDMLNEGTATIARTFELIADADRHAVVFHCAAGKDRTGVIAALLLATLGVDRETIAADYHRSADAVVRFGEWLAATNPEAADSMTAQPAAFASCPPEAMMGFLAGVEDRWGDAGRFVAEIGVGDDVVADLRASLLV